jgi:hypothetical protein
MPKKKSHTLKIVFLLFILVVLIIGGWCCFKFYRTHTSYNEITEAKIGEDVQQILYYRIEEGNPFKPSMSTYNVFNDAFESQGIKLIKSSTYDISIWTKFDTLNHIDEYMTKIKFSPLTQFIYGLNYTDLLASKSSLIETLRKNLPVITYEAIVPKSYITSSVSDMVQFTKDRGSRKVYILKKNIQRQEGHYITDSIDDAMKKKNDYVVIQEMLQNPYLVNAYKINLRIYLLIVVFGKSDVKFFYYNDGFIYYTPQHFEPLSTDMSKIITTGYVDRKMYDENPMTHKELANVIGESAYTLLSNNIKTLLQHVKTAYSDILLQGNKKFPGNKFLIYGVDIAPDINLGCKLMEINKGPDLTYKDDRDKTVKLSMVKEALQIVGLFGTKPRTLRNDFIEL